MRFGRAKCGAVRVCRPWPSRTAALAHDLRRVRNVAKRVAEFG